MHQKETVEANADGHIHRHTLFFFPSLFPLFFQSSLALVATLFYIALVSLARKRSHAAACWLFSPNGIEDDKKNLFSFQCQFETTRTQAQAHWIKLLESYTSSSLKSLIEGGRSDQLAASFGVGSRQPGPYVVCY